LIRHRADANQPDIVEALRERGVDVWIIGRPCDLLCQRAERYYLLDCSGATKNRKRDPDQLKNFQIWRVKVVKDEAEALKAVGL
jgi:hypothetical protein